MARLWSFISILVLFICSVFAVASEAGSDLAIVNKPISFHEPAGFTDAKGKKKKKIRCEAFSRKHGAGKVTDAHHITNFLIGQGNKPYKFSGARIVSLYKTAAVNVYLNQFGNATMTLKEIGQYGNSIIKACHKHGLAHGIQYVPAKGYKASGFHADYESVWVEVAFNNTGKSH